MDGTRRFNGWNAAVQWLEKQLPCGGLALYAKNGVDKVADITVSETDGGQQITCHLAGEYVADLTFHRAGGSEGGEDLVVHDVTITVSEP